MKLLIITQKVDKNDPILGFFHSWLVEFASKVEMLHVVCLEKGEYDLPSNVFVHSLGKEDGRSKIKYTWKFFKYIYSLRREYENVFVHMNQEYVLLAGLWWKINGKRVFLWRNHKKGNLLTRVAVLFSQKVFCTSPDAFVARFKKTIQMPVGIDTTIFSLKINQILENTFLVLGRADPVKRVDTIIDAVKILKEKGVAIKVHIVGDSSDRNNLYMDYLKNKTLEAGLDEDILFFPAVPYTEVSVWYRKYNLFINLTPEGSLDKTIFEAIASGLVPVVGNSFFEGKLPNDLIVNTGDSKRIANALEYALYIAHSVPPEFREKMKQLSEENSLQNLSKKLMYKMSV